MAQINKQQLEEILSSDNANGNTFISIETLTTPKLKGGLKNPQQGRIVKKSVSNVMIFQNKHTNGYNNMVKRRLENEGKDPESFQLHPRKWGERVENTPLVKHKDQTYLEVIFIKNISTEFFLDDELINKDEVIGFQSRKPDQGGLDNSVIIRTYKLDSIKKIKINKEEYLIK